MKISGKLLTGLILGAGAMFLLDPDRGTRRRALARDRGIRASRKLSEGLGSTARDLRNRTSGAAAELKARFGGDTGGTRSSRSGFARHSAGWYRIPIRSWWRCMTAWRPSAGRSSRAGWIR